MSPPPITRAEVRRTTLADVEPCLARLSGSAKHRRRSGALAHWLSTCLSSRAKAVRFRCASPPLIHTSNDCPRGAIGRHKALKPPHLRVRVAPGIPAHHIPIVSPSWWNGRHTCLRNRRASIPSSNLGEGTNFHLSISSAVEQRLDKAQADGSIPSSTTTIALVG